MLDRHFHAVLDDAPDGVLIEARGDRVVYLNPAYARMLNYPSTTELSGASIRDIAHPEDYDRLSWFGRCRSDGKPAPTRYTFRALGRAGVEKTFDATISQTRVDGMLLITTIVRALAHTAEVHAHDLALPGTDRLSARELEVLQLILQGKRSKVIATELGISEKTICTHRSRAFQKLALRGDRDLFLRAAELGLI
jgi:PAS domain S-box-containing protein